MAVASSSTGSVHAPSSQMVSCIGSLIQFPAASDSSTYTVFSPSSGARTHCLVSAKGSGADHAMPSLLKLICAPAPMPLPSSSADIVRATTRERVVSSPLLVTNDPMGGVVSSGGTEVVVEVPGIVVVVVTGTGEGMVVGEGDGVVVVVVLSSWAGKVTRTQAARTS